MFIPSMSLKQLYTKGSLVNTSQGRSSLLKKRLKDTKINELIGIKVNDKEFQPDKISLKLVAEK